MIRALVVCLLAALSVLGCGSPAERAERTAKEQATAWLAEAAAAHAEADQATTDAARDEARDRLESATRAVPPPGIVPEHALLVRLDLHERLAGLELAARRPEAALAIASAGLALGEPESPFTSALHIVRGGALEAMGREVDATAEYEAAMKISEALLERALGPEEKKP